MKEVKINFPEISNQNTDKYTFIMMVATFLLVTVPETIFQVSIPADFIPVLIQVVAEKNWIGLIEIALPLLAVVSRIRNKLVADGLTMSQVLNRIKASQNFHVKLVCIVLGAITLLGVVFPENAAYEIVDAVTGGNLGRATTVLFLTFINPIIIRFRDNKTVSA